MSDHIPFRTDSTHKANRKRKLIDATIECIHRQGLEGTTISRITQTAKLPAGSVRSQFGTKEKLLLETLTSIRDELRTGFDESLHGLEDPEEILDRIVRIHFGRLALSTKKITAWHAFSGTGYINGDFRGIRGTLDKKIRETLEESFSVLCRQQPDTHPDPVVLAGDLEKLISTCLRGCLYAPDPMDPSDAVMLCRSYLSSLFPGRFSSIEPAPGKTVAAQPSNAVVRGGQSDLLPRWTYRNPEFFELEIEHLFRPNWMLAGHVSDVATPGDYLTFEGFGERALVIRGDDGRLRAFHNVCRHRGAMLLNQPRGRCSHALSCPFHGWTYDIRGKLMSVPARHTFGQLELETNGLVPLELEIWMGFVFHPLPDRRRLPEGHHGAGGTPDRPLSGGGNDALVRHRIPSAKTLQLEDHPRHR